MKFRVTFKTPDVIDDEINYSVALNKGLADIEQDDLRHDLHQFVKKWIEYGEYVRLEFDTDAKTCVVVEAE